MQLVKLLFVLCGAFCLFLLFSRDEYSDPPKLFKKIPLWVVIIALLLGYPLINRFLAPCRMGAFFETDREYTAQYEAYVYVDQKPIFCIVDVAKEKVDSDHHTYDYIIEKIYLPYGKTLEAFPNSAYNDYDYNSDVNWVSYEDGDCRITITDLADETSFPFLETTVISSYGDYCASRNVNTFHANSCLSASNILPKNKIFFESEAEAILFGYRPCDLCL